VSYLLSSDLFAVTETAIVFLHLFGLIFCSAVSYGFYFLTASTFSQAKMNETGITIFTGATCSFMSLCGTFGILALTYHFGWRYRASQPGRFIARLPGIRLIPHVYRKYWLPSGTSLRPRPRFFYLKRFIIRQSELSYHFP
jgi:hypothetical protein